MVADLFGNFNGDRTGVGLFLGYAKSRKEVNNSLCFDLEFAGKLIDAYLGCVTHASLGTFLFLLLGGSVGFRRCSGRGGSLGGRFFSVGFGFGGRLG